MKSTAMIMHEIEELRKTLGQQHAVIKKLINSVKPSILGKRVSKLLHIEKRLDVKLTSELMQKVKKEVEEHNKILRDVGYSKGYSLFGHSRVVTTWAMGINIYSPKSVILPLLQQI